MYCINSVYKCYRVYQLLWSIISINNITNYAVVLYDFVMTDYLFNVIMWYRATKYYLFNTVFIRNL